jgi:hypothetical protein
MVALGPKMSWMASELHTAANDAVVFATYEQPLLELLVIVCIPTGDQIISLRSK